MWRICGEMMDMFVCLSLLGVAPVIWYLKIMDLVSLCIRI